MSHSSSRATVLAPTHSTTKEGITESPFVRFPVELIRYIFKLAATSSHVYHRRGTQKEDLERHLTLKILCLVSSSVRAIALPLLLEHVHFDLYNLWKTKYLSKTLEDHETQADMIRTLELTLGADELDAGEQDEAIERAAASVMSTLTRCRNLEELVLHGGGLIEPTQTFPGLVGMLKSLALTTLYDVDDYICELPHLEHLILYGTSSRHDLDHYVHHLPQLKTLVYFHDVDSPRAERHPFPHLTKLALPHDPFTSQITSEESLDVIHFPPTEYWTQDCWVMREWLKNRNSSVDGTEKHVRFRDGNDKEELEFILGAEGFLDALLAKSDVSSLVFPSSWFRDDPWRNKLDDLKEMCEERKIILEFDDEPCMGAIYFLSTQWWKIPQRIDSD